MDDVRAIVAILFRAHTAILAGLLLTLAATAGRRRAQEAVAVGLRYGALATVAVAAGVGVFMVLAWDTFFDGFHRLFFEGRTWWFYADDTLRRVYPDAFWMGVAAWIAGIATVFTAIVLLGASIWRRRLRRRASVRAGAGAPGDEWGPAA